jgi:hypothetical protein
MWRENLGHTRRKGRALALEVRRSSRRIAAFASFF